MRLHMAYGIPVYTLLASWIIKSLSERALVFRVEFGLLTGDAPIYVEKQS